MFSIACCSQDKSSMKMITLTKQDNSQVAAQFPLNKLGKPITDCFSEDLLLFTFQISSLQIRCLPSMSVCYSLDVSSASCLVQMKTNMVNNQTFFRHNIEYAAFLYNIYQHYNEFCFHLGHNLFGWGDWWEPGKVRHCVLFSKIIKPLLACFYNVVLFFHSLCP